MSAFLFGLVLFGILMVLLALFSGRGAGETVVRSPARRPDVAALPLPDLVRALRDVYASRGYTVLSEAMAHDHADLLLEDTSPLTGQTIYLRCALPGDSGAVDSLEVQAALDRARGDQLGKAVVATTGGFSGEARLLARDANVELIDSEALEGLLDRRAREGRPLVPRSQPVSM
ncbi:MAG TPA: restriction endonuclease [Myxococcales bacterium]|nr:restriction endonuclease [Myxococcales bacterium]